VDNELEVIRDEMEQTRANLADKLGALETQVRETVVGAKEAVSSTVEGVKEVVGSVSETMGTVAETFDVTKQVDRHPWAAMGAAVAAGFVAAQLFDRLGQRPAAPAATARTDSLSDLPLTTTRFSEPPPTAAPKKEGMLESMMPDLHGVMNTMLSSLGGLAVNSLFGVIRQLAARELPEEWKGEVGKLVDQVASQLGGRPIDETRSSQLLDALGLGEKKEETQAQETRSCELRQEGAPYDPVTRPVGAGDGPQGVRARDGRYTTNL
jgi:ElaB/YqjD/DUF883 family membrane-anchored ribosome-binding protein